MEETGTPTPAQPQRRIVRKPSEAELATHQAAAARPNQRTDHVAEAITRTRNGAGASPGDAAAALAMAGADSIVETLPNGHKVEIGAPGFATVFRIAKLMNSGPERYTDPAAMMLIQSTLKTLLYVKAIDGQKLRPIENMNEAHALAAQIGDDGLEAVTFAINQHFSGVTAEQIEALKKNLPG